jgi:RimJ/RimL family protein N-acetyltransferase
MSGVYELRVRGHLDDRLASWLGDLTIVRNVDGTSTITASATDQSRLHGLLAGLRDLGAPLLSLQAVANPPPGLPWVVVTERLSLRPGSVEDAEATWEYRRLPRVAEWLTEIPHNLATYRATFEDPGRLATTVLVELEGRVIGDFMLRVGDAWAQVEVADGGRNSQAELGWVLDPRFTGNGYATEAVQALLRVCFEDLGVRRVTATCFLGNESSWRLMERVGMRRETHAVAESLHRSGRWLDTVGYALLADEWAELSARADRAGAPSRQRSGGC